MESTLKGAGESGVRSPAVINYNGGSILLRDVATTGYRRALADMTTPDFAAAWRVEGDDKPGSAGPDIREYSSSKVVTLFPSPAESLRLPRQGNTFRHLGIPGAVGRRRCLRCGSHRRGRLRRRHPACHCLRRIHALFSRLLQVR